MTKVFMLAVSSLFVLAATAAAQPAPPDPAQQPPPTEQPPVPAPEPPKEDKKDTAAGYDKGFYVKSPEGRYTMRVNLRVQPFYNWTRVQPAMGDPVYANNFEVRRGRLTLEGTVHT
jgi:hypothetical protein